MPGQFQDDLVEASLKETPTDSKPEVPVFTAEDPVCLLEELDYVAIDEPEHLVDKCIFSKQCLKPVQSRERVSKVTEGLQDRFQDFRVDSCQLIVSFSHGSLGVPSQVLVPVTST